jgi:serpin B
MRSPRRAVSIVLAIRIGFSFAGFALSFALSGCSGVADPADRGDAPPATREIPPELEGEVEGIVGASNRLAFALYAQLAERDGNLIVSPYSIYEALAMVSAGAAGETEAEIADVLLRGPDVQGFHAGCNALRESLGRGGAAGWYSLRIANGLWGQEGYGLLEEFVTILRDYHGAGLVEVDFAQAPEESRASINSWVKDRTGGRIEELFPPGSIDTLTRLAVANAIAFQGTWIRKFDADLTAATAFDVTPDHAVMAEMMTQVAAFPIGALPGVTALEMPYSPGDLSMIFLLPSRSSSLAELEERLDVEFLETVVGELVEEEVEVFIPRFEFAADVDLIPVLQGLGVRAAFDPHNADFSRVSGRRDLYLGAAVHQAFVRVDEQGTEAAAATGFSGWVTSGPRSFRADRPFLFIIRDDVTGAVLFVGRVADPSR